MNVSQFKPTYILTLRLLALYCSVGYSRYIIIIMYNNIRQSETIYYVFGIFDVCLISNRVGIVANLNF